MREGEYPLYHFMTLHRYDITTFSDVNVSLTRIWYVIQCYIQLNINNELLLFQYLFNTYIIWHFTIDNKLRKLYLYTYNYDEKKNSEEQVYLILTNNKIRKLTYRAILNGYYFREQGI